MPDHETFGDISAPDLEIDPAKRPPREQMNDRELLAAHAETRIQFMVDKLLKYENVSEEIVAHECMRIALRTILSSIHTDLSKFELDYDKSEEENRNNFFDTATVLHCRNHSYIRMWQKTLEKLYPSDPNNLYTYSTPPQNRGN